MKKYECLVKRGGVTEKIIRYFTNSECAHVWLELEGYRVICIKELTMNGNNEGAIMEELIRKIEMILIETGQHDLKFKLGEIIKYSPTEVGEILRKHKDELRQSIGRKSK